LPGLPRQWNVGRTGRRWNIRRWYGLRIRRGLVDDVRRPWEIRLWRLFNHGTQTLCNKRAEAGQTSQVATGLRKLSVHRHPGAVMA
jgi:hypothetical protein